MTRIGPLPRLTPVDVPPNTPPIGANAVQKARPQLRPNASQSTRLVPTATLLATPFVGVGAAPAWVLGEEDDWKVAALVVPAPDPPEVDVQTLLHNLQPPPLFAYLPFPLPFVSSPSAATAALSVDGVKVGRSLASKSAFLGR